MRRGEVRGSGYWYDGGRGHADGVRVDIRNWLQGKIKCLDDDDVSGLHSSKFSRNEHQISSSKNSAVVRRGHVSRVGEEAS